MLESFDAEGREEEFDFREHPEEREEMEKFAAEIIGTDWREQVSRRELVDFWIWHGGKHWKKDVEFLRDWWREQKRMFEGEGEKIPESELRALGECIEPTEELYASYRRFQEKACCDFNEENVKLGLPPSHRVLSYEEFVAMVEDWKLHDPAELYRKAHLWQMDYEEYCQELSDSMHRACEQVIAFFEKRRK